MVTPVYMYTGGGATVGRGSNRKLPSVGTSGGDRSSITTCPTKAVYGIIVCLSGHGAFSTVTVSHFPLREGDYLRSFIVLFSKGVWLIWVDA